MINVLLPFLVLPLYAAMRRIDPRLLHVAETLGASRMEIFWRVFFPLTAAALGAGMILIFILSLGFYITPAILGGGRYAHRQYDGSADQQIRALGDGGGQLRNSADGHACLLRPLSETREKAG